MSLLQKSKIQVIPEGFKPESRY